MTERRGNMFDVLGTADYFLVTTNSTINRFGNLVMGRGAAKQLCEHCPKVAKALGDKIRGSDYYIQDSGLYVKKSRLWAFQVKRYWKQKANPFLIRTATMILIAKAKNNPSKEFHLNFPGIGNGGLPINQVLPTVQELPDNCFVWRW